MTASYRVITPTADLREIPDAQRRKGKLESQLLYGEVFIAEDVHDGWVRGICAHDRYPGYIEQRFLTEDVTQPTHIITAARSHVYAEPTMKSPLVSNIGIGSRVCITEQGEKYVHVDGMGWISKRHLMPLSETRIDHAATAMALLETPYYWGGRSGFGIDCSGLVQIALALAGITAPRDTEHQETSIGTAIDHRDLVRGDIVFFPNHVGIMVDDAHIIHANAFHMKTIIEPLRTVEDRSRDTDGKGITSVARV